MNKLDFGSGYNPEKDFKTCDIYGYVDYYFDPISYKVNTDDKFDYIRCRNVIHHIKDIDKLSQEFNRLLTDGGTLEIIECRKEYYNENFKIWSTNKFAGVKHPLDMLADGDIIEGLKLVND